MAFISCGLATHSILNKMLHKGGYMKTSCSTCYLLRTVHCNLQELVEAMRVEQVIHCG